MNVPRITRFRNISLASGIAAAILGVTASVILKTGPYSTPVATLIGLMPVPAYGLLIWSIVQMVREMDEMQRRVQFEAAATALLATVFYTITYGWLEKARVVPHMNLAFISLITLAFYMLGLFIAMRHYR
jgi:hypothetical protein